MFTMNRDIVKLNKTSKDMVGRKQKAPEPRKLSIDSGEILEEVYAQLGGVQGSVLYWRNHEEDFRNQVEAKFLTKQVLKDAAVAQGQEVAKNIFNVFIANNGLAAQKNEMPQVEATIVNPELEDK